MIFPLCPGIHSDAPHRHVVCWAVGVKVSHTRLLKKLQPSWLWRASSYNDFGKFFTVRTTLYSVAQLYQKQSLALEVSVLPQLHYYGGRGPPAYLGGVQCWLKVSSCSESQIKSYTENKKKSIVAFKHKETSQACNLSAEHLWLTGIKTHTEKVNISCQGCCHKHLPVKEQFLVKGSPLKNTFLRVSTLQHHLDYFVCCVSKATALVRINNSPKLTSRFF